MTKRELGTAIVHFRAALRLDANDTDTRFSLARCLFAQKKTKEAAGEFRLVLGAQPNNLFAANNLAWILATH